MRKTIHADFTSYDNAEVALRSIREKGIKVSEYKIRLRVRKSALEEYAFFGFPAVTLPEQNFTMMAYSRQHEPNHNEGQAVLSMSVEAGNTEGIHAILYNQHATNVREK